MTETTVPADIPAPATPAAAAPAVAKDERNGVTRPKTGTQTGTVWDICDKLSKETGKPAERQGSMVMVSPSLKRRMCNWQVVMPSSTP